MSTSDMRAARCTKCGAVYSYPMGETDPHKCPSLHRVRTRSPGDHRPAYRDVLAQSPSDATRIVMERFPHVSEATYIGPSPAGAKDGDSV